jgi:hypothetical protein
MSAFETQEWESAGSSEVLGEWEDRWAGSGEFEGRVMSGAEMESESGSQEAELAAELLEVSSEEELEEFLGKLIRGAAKAVGGVVRSPIGKALGGALKNVAKSALPVAAGALGNFVLPGVGGLVGSKLGSMAANLFEVELESMGEQEAEFEVARRYVRFATAAARNAARAPSGSPPRAVARAAVLSAARRHAPGLVRPARPGSGRPSRRPRPRAGSYGFPPGADVVVDLGGPDEDPQPDGDDDFPESDAGEVTGGNGSGRGDRKAPAGRWVRRGTKIVIFGV